MRYRSGGHGVQRAYGPTSYGKTELRFFEMESEMSKAAYERVLERPRWKVAKANLQILEFLFWEHIEEGQDESASTLLPFLLREAGRAALQSPDIQENAPGFRSLVSEAKAKQAIEMLEGIPKNNFWYWKTKDQLWSAVISGWLKTKDQQMALQLMGRLLKNLRCSEGKEFKNRLRKELEIEKEREQSSCANKIFDTLKALTEVPEDDIVIILMHVYVRYAPPSAVLAKIRN